MEVKTIICDICGNDLREMNTESLNTTCKMQVCE